MMCNLIYYFKAFKPEASCDLHKQDMLLDPHPLLFLQQYFYQPVNVVPTFR